MSARSDGRAADEIRPTVLNVGFMPYAEGSCLVEMGNTKVICTASVTEGVPRWLKGKGSGWLTAEYSMLPRSSPERIEREVNKGRVSGRTQEIQRLIGRSLRATIDLAQLGEWTIVIDCDVLQADGGTRTAAITGGSVSLGHAIAQLLEQRRLARSPLTDSVAAISVGIVGGDPMLDLKYDEDSAAEVDMNVVMTGTDKLVEVQGTAERGVFDRSELDEMLALAGKGIRELSLMQQKAVDASLFA